MLLSQLRTTTEFEPAHEKRVLITQATSKDSGEPAHKCSLARAFVVCEHVAVTLRKLTANNPCLWPKYRTAHGHLNTNHKWETIRAKLFKSKGVIS